MSEEKKQEKLFPGLSPIRLKQLRDHEPYKLSFEESQERLQEAAS